MTLVSSIITSAYRETNLIGLGVIPSAEETTEGLDRLQNIVTSTLGFEAGEQLEQLPLGRNEIETPSGFPWYGDSLPQYTCVPLNTRLMLNLSSDSTVSLHPTPCDGARFGIVDVSQNLATNNLVVNGNGRLIESSATLTLNTNSLSREWFYRADLGDWKRVSTLLTSDQMPFPAEFDDMFITLLAMRLNPRHGNTLDPSSQAALNRSRSQFRSRYKQTDQMDSELGLTRLSGSRIGGSPIISSTNSFNSGHGY